jgi:ABC-type Fe3+ transport system permease subunit
MKYAWVFHIIILLAILLCAISPFWAVAYAGSVAEKYGCELNEGSIHPCVVKGVDRGEDLYSLGMLGWLGIATVPLGLAAAVLYILVVLIVYLVMRFRRKKAEQEVT